MMLLITGRCVKYTNTLSIQNYYATESSLVTSMELAGLFVETFVKELERFPISVIETLTV